MTSRLSAPLERSPLLTDLYQLAMMQAYLEAGRTETAVFEFFVRRLPGQRRFLVAAGLAQVVAWLADLAFDREELDWLRQSGRFSPALIDYLGSLRFTGDVDAMPEGRVFFADEPILRVAAPLPVAQLIETRIVNLLHFQTLIASKAARTRLVAPTKTLIDFGLRRAHGAEAGLLAARAAWIGGFDGTATLLANAAWDIPVYGTMAHAFVQAFDSETEAFVAFAHARPQGLVLLIDTYDCAEAAASVAALAPHFDRDGIRIGAVRIDSGDLGAEARRVRSILDAAGLADVRIMASGGIDDVSLARLEGEKAPIDGYGIGTSLTTSADAPSLDCAYKLQEYAGIARRKLSPGKETWPGRKQVWRRCGDDGRIVEDVLTLVDDPHPGEALLVPVMRAGRPATPAAIDLAAARARCAEDLRRLPAAATDEGGSSFRPRVAAPLRALATSVDARIRGLRASRIGTAAPAADADG